MQDQREQLLEDARRIEECVQPLPAAAINDGAISFSPVEVTYDEALGVLRLAL